MKLFRIFTISLLMILIFSGYILPYWFILKESANARSKFNIDRFSFSSTATLKEKDTTILCNAEFVITKKERETNIKIICEENISEFKFKDDKLISQNLKSNGKLFIKPLTAFIENEDIILPLPISSERLKSRVCQIVEECNDVIYKRLGGIINYQFYSPKKENYYMVEKESFLPSALFIKEKNLGITAKKYYSFSTNIKFPSIIEIQNDNQLLILNVDDIDINSQ